MFVCMYVCMYVCNCVLCMYVCMYVCLYVCMYVCMYVYMSMYVRTYVCMYVLELSRYYEIPIKTETKRYDTIIELLSMNVDYRPITICARAIMCACSVH